MVLMSWVGLKERCPIDVSRLVTHSNSFNSLVGIRINERNLDNAKKSLIDARGELDLMFISIRQFLSDRSILKNKIDEIFYGWLIDDVGRYLKKLDELEESLLLKFDSLDSDREKNRAGVSRLSSFAKSLKLANSIIYESLNSSIEEYDNLQEGRKIISPAMKGSVTYIAVAYDNSKKKVIQENGEPLIIKEKGKPLMVSFESDIPEEIAIIEKNKRTFLYIFFQKLQSTMSTIGGLAREGKTNMLRKGQVGGTPTTWQGFMSNEGQKKIAKTHEAETGEKIFVDESMIDNSGDPEADNFDYPHEEIVEEGEEGGDEDDEQDN